MPTISNNKQIAKNTFMLYLRMLISLVVGLYTSRVVLQTLGVEDYGIYGVVGGVVSMLGFLNATMSGATSRFLSFELGKGNKQSLQETFSAAFFVHLVIAVIVLFFAETVGLWFLCNKLVIPETRLVAAHWVYQFSIIATLLGIVQTPYTACIMSHEKMNVYAYFELVNVTLKLLIVYLLVISSWDKLIIYSLLVLLVSIFMQSLYRHYCRKYFSESYIVFQVKKSKMLPLLSFSGWDLYGNMAYTCKQQGISFLINIFFGVAYNAASGVAATLQGVVSGLAFNITTAFRPAIIKEFSAGNKTRAANLIYLGAKFTGLLMIILALPIIFELELIMQLWLKEVPDYAVLFCQLLLVNSCVHIVGHTLSIGIHATGNIKMTSFLVGTNEILLIPVLWLFYHESFPVHTAYLLTIVQNAITVVIRGVILQKQFCEFQLITYLKKVILSLAFIFFVSYSYLFFWTSQIDDFFYRLVFGSIIDFLLVLVLSYSVLLNVQEKHSVVAWIKNQYNRLFHGI